MQTTFENSNNPTSQLREVTLKTTRAIRQLEQSHMLDFVVTWDGTGTFSKVITGCYKIVVFNHKISATVKQRTQHFGNAKKVVALQENSLTPSLKHALSTNGKFVSTITKTRTENVCRRKESLCVKLTSARNTDSPSCSHR